MVWCVHHEKNDDKTDLIILLNPGSETQKQKF